MGCRIHPQGPPWAIQGVWPPAVKGPGWATLSHLRLFPDQFEVVPLQFSKDLDAHNPNTPEWREDVGLVVSRLLSKETSIPEELMVTVRLTAIQQVLNAQKISFLLRGGVRVVVAMRDVDTDSPSLGGGGGYWAVAILFVSGLFAVGAFILYKFKRQGLASLGSPGICEIRAPRLTPSCWFGSSGLGVSPLRVTIGNSLETP
ncbi:hypothetical protein Celaphus_00017202 [Cervus elaphus hippelaphus]|uniref:Uncharacterized protein n=1 Tax=Cervus elaphus hippelaphus TaxID=46360 RepID=A0A212D5P9_CEREH|nr:hypothetical protein Celaphus_00017202 [Cervus elaphus hippelaphus]